MLRTSLLQADDALYTGCSRCYYQPAFPVCIVDAAYWEKERKDGKVL